MAEEDLGEQFGDLGQLQDFYRNTGSGSGNAAPPTVAAGSSGSTGGASLLSLGAIAEEASDLAAITGEVADGASLHATGGRASERARAARSHTPALPRHSRRLARARG